MKRFHSTLARVLRLRQQTERMARLIVTRARSEFNAAETRVTDAQMSAARREADLARRLTQPGASQVVRQAQLELAAAAATVRQLLDERTACAARLTTVVDAYRLARREREVVERAVAQHRDEHRRNQGRAVAVELNERALRPTRPSMIADREELEHA